MKGLLGVKRNIFALGLVSFFTDLSTEMIYPLLPLFLTSVLGVNKAFIGLVEGLAESTASLFKVGSGWLSDRLGKRRSLVLLGYSLSTVAKPFLALATSGPQVLGIRFAERIGKGIRTSPRDAIIADSTPSGERGKSYGFHRALDTLGAVFGPLTAFILLPLLSYSYRKIFLISFLPGLAACLLIPVLVIEPKRVREEIPIKLSLRGFDRDFKFFLIVMAVFTLGNTSDAFLILRARDLGVGAGVVPLLWLLFNLVYSALALPGGLLSDRWGRKRILELGFGFYLLIYLGFAFASHPMHIWLLFLSYGLFYGLTVGTIRAWVAELAPPSRMATAFGLFHTTVGILALPASLIMGFLWQLTGAKLAFSWCALLAGIALILLVTLPGGEGFNR